MSNLGTFFGGEYAHSALHTQLGQLHRLQSGEGGENPNDVLVLDLGLHNDSPQVTNTRDTIKYLLRQEGSAV